MAEILASYYAHIRLLQASEYFSEHTHIIVSRTPFPARRYRGVSSAMQASKRTKPAPAKKEK